MTKKLEFRSQKLQKYTDAMNVPIRLQGKPPLLDKTSQPQNTYLFNSMANRRSFSKKTRDRLNFSKACIHAHDLF